MVDQMRGVEVGGGVKREVRCLWSSFVGYPLSIPALNIASIRVLYRFYSSLVRSIGLNVLVQRRTEYKCCYQGCAGRGIAMQGRRVRTVKRGLLPR